MVGRTEIPRTAWGCLAGSLQWHQRSGGLETKGSLPHSDFRGDLRSAIKKLWPSRIRLRNRRCGTDDRLSQPNSVGDRRAIFAIADNNGRFHIADFRGDLRSAIKNWLSQPNSVGDRRAILRSSTILQSFDIVGDAKMFAFAYYKLLDKAGMNININLYYYTS